MNLTFRSIVLNARYYAARIFRPPTAREIFTKKYLANSWRSGESASGHGSELRQTRVLLSGLNKLIVELQILSILDIPCGDFNWMQMAALEGVDYVGADIVQPLVESNRRRFARPGIRFEVLDLTRDELPRADLILCRDCLVHLSYEDATRAVKHMKASGSRYLLTTTFTALEANSDVSTGGWRPLNLRLSPFAFPAPIMTINEDCTEGYPDKSVSLWALNDLPTLEPKG